MLLFVSAVEEEDKQTNSYPGEADDAAYFVGINHDQPGDGGSDAAQHCSQGYLPPLDIDIEGYLEGARQLWFFNTQGDDGSMRQCVSQHGAESIKVNQQFNPARAYQYNGDGGKDQDRVDGHMRFLTEVTEKAGKLLPLSHEIGQAGYAEHAGICRDYKYS